MNKALQRLSTGYRINSSKDDSAGLAISTNLDYKISSYKVAKNNTQMGQSMLETVSGSLSNIKNMLQRMRDLAEQSANGTYGDDERNAMQTEVDALTDEIFRIKNTTEFNGRKILGEEEQIKVTEAEALSQGYTIVKSAQELYKVFHNDDGTQNLNAKVMLFSDIDLNDLKDIDGNGSNWVAIGSDISKAYSGIFDGNGFTINNLKINKPNDDNQGFIGYGNGAIIKNVTFENVKITGKGQIGGIFGCSNNGRVENCTVIGDINAKNSIAGMIGGRFFNFPVIDNCKVSGVVNGGNYLAGVAGISGRCTISNCKIDVKVNPTGPYSNGIITGECKGTVKNCEYNSEINKGMNLAGSATLTDVIGVKNLNVSDIQNTISVETNLQIGINNHETSVIDVDTGFSLDTFKISLGNNSSSRKALDKIDAMIEKVTSKMTEIGAVQNRLESSMEFQDTHITALTASNSLIKDADIAEESSNYIRSQILQQTTATLLATANQAPSIALQLI